MTAIDVAGIRGISSDLKSSAEIVFDQAVAAKSAATDVDTSGAGRDYRKWGDRVARACVDVAGVLATYSQCVTNCSTALEVAASAYEQQDQATANEVAAVEAGIPT
ncbi:hypothetical protein [Nocardia sp. NPDC049707]|uniref:hypothetical protein n=1 Tax=Nocardia sp. NPDC049707 TaxID=3154735 RepID=UPI003446CCEE